MDPNRLSKGIIALVKLVTQLRGPDGCPWDARQTDSSIKTYLLEETYEVLDAIEESSPQDVCAELGDLLFQVLFLADLAADREEFDITEVIEKITHKMIHRHPHVFGQEKVNSAEDVALNWAKIKEAEKGTSKDTTSLLKSIPANMPALLRAHRLGERASKAGFSQPDAAKIWDRVQEEFDRLKMAIAGKDKDLFTEEMGALLFSLVDLSRLWNLNAEHLLRSTNHKFIECFKDTETGLKASGIRLEEDELNQT